MSQSIPNTASPQSRPLRIQPLAFGISLCALLAGCDDGYDHHDICYSCGYTPTEISKGVVSADFNGDGFADVVALSSIPGSSYLKTYLSTAAGAYAAPTVTPDGNNPLYVATADLNGDGFKDLVTASYDDGTLNVFFNDKASPGTFNTPLVLSSPGASQVAIADMNGDGMPDLISADFNVSLFVQTSPGVFAAPISLYSGGANWVAVGDLNGDGMPDIAVADEVGVKLLMHSGVASATTYAAPVSIFTQTPNGAYSGANVVAIADVNGDGLNDLIITDPGPTGLAAPTVTVLIQNHASPGTFLAPVVYDIAPYSLATSIVVTDVNGDGFPDLVIGGTTATSVLLQSASSRGTFM